MTVDITRISYKPGWSFEWVGATEDAIVIAKVPSSIHPDKPARIVRRIKGAFWMTEVDLFCALLAAIKWIEAHEFAEFFKIDGMHVFRPHDGTKTLFPPPEIAP